MKYTAMITQHDGDHRYVADHLYSDDLEKLKRDCLHHYHWNDEDKEMERYQTFEIYESGSGRDITETEPFQYVNELRWIDYD